MPSRAASAHPPARDRLKTQQEINRAKNEQIIKLAQRVHRLEKLERAMTVLEALDGL